MALRDGLEFDLLNGTGVAADLSDNGYTVTINGTPNNINNQLGGEDQAKEYDGSTDYLTANVLADDRETANDGEGSFAGWIRLADAPSDVATICSYTNITTSTLLAADVQTNGTLRFRVRDNGTTDFALDTDDAVPYGRWFHFACIQDGADPVIYIDGILVDQAFATDVDNNAWIDDSSQTIDGFAIGASRVSSTTQQYWQDDIGNIKVWSRALSQAEVIEDYNNGKPSLAKDLVFDLRYKQGLFKDVSTNAYATPFTGTTTLTLAEDHNGDRDNAFQSTGANLTNAVDLTALLTPLASTTEGTWSAWVYREANDSLFPVVFGIGDANANEYIILQLGNGANKIRARAQTPTLQWQFVSTDDCPLGWFHIALVQDGTSSDIEVYLNGEILAGAISGADQSHWIGDNVSLDNFLLGGLEWNSSGEPRLALSNGDRIADPRIYSRALSQAELLELYQRGNVPGFGDLTDLEFRGEFVKGLAYDASSFNHVVENTDNSSPTTNERNKDDQALDYDGSTSFLNVDGLTTTAASDTEGTIAFWIKFDDATPGSTEAVLSFGDTNANERLGIEIPSDGQIFGICADNGTNQWQIETDTAPFTDGEWSHMALVHNGTEPSIYINGVLQATTFVINTDRTIWLNDLAGIDNFRIGCRNYNNGGNAIHVAADISNVRIWSRPLGAAEIREDMAQGAISISRGRGLRDGLVFELKGSSLEDTSGSNITVTNNGTIVSGEGYGPFSNSRTYGGISQYISFPDIITSLEETTNGTLEIWCRPSTSAPAQNGNLFLINGGSNNYIYLAQASGTDNARLILAANGSIVYDVIYFDRLPVDEWTHVAVVQDGIAVKLYINSVLVTADSVVTGTDPSSWFNNAAWAGTPYADIGGRDDTTTQEFEGEIGTSRIWNRALSAQEVKRVFADQFEDYYSLLDGMFLDLPLREDNLLEAVSDQSFTNNGSTSTTDRFGIVDGARQFDGSDYLQATVSGVTDFIYQRLVGGGQETWSFWIKPVDATPAANDRVMGYLDDDGNAYIMFQILTTGEARFRATNATEEKWRVDTDAAAFSDDTWSHVVVTQDGLNPAIYINGVKPDQTFGVTTDKSWWVMNDGDIDEFEIGSVDFNNGGSHKSIYRRYRRC